MRLTGLIAASAIAIAAPAMAADPPPDAALKLAREVIAPRFAEVEAAAAAQETAWTGFCGHRASADPQPLLQAYERLSDVWARVEFVRMGPAAAELRAERFNYWLDRENATGKALNAMLAGGPLDAASLKAGSVGGQGMPLIERLLWGPDALDKLKAAGPDGDRRCAVGSAVAASLHGLAGEMSGGWNGPDGIVAAMTAGKPWGVAFADRTEASRVLLTDLVGGVENLKDSKVAFAFHDEANPAAPRLAEEARSGRSLHDAMLNFHEVRKAVETYMQPASPEQKQTMATAFDAVEAKLRAAAQARDATPPNSPERVATLQAAVASLVDLQQLALTVVPAGSGVALGFNNLDGD